MNNVTVTIKYELNLKPLKHLTPLFKGSSYKINIGWYSLATIMLKHFYFTYGEYAFIKRNSILNSNIEILKHIINYEKINN
jgi:hypothetical protein